MPYLKPENAPTIQTLFSLKGKVAVIIGGAGLLGGEIAYGFAEMGASIILASRDPDKLNTFAAGLSAKFDKAEVHCLEVDISKKSSVENFTKCVSKLTGGQVDILVNSGWSGNKNTLDSISDDDWNNDIETCLNGVFRTIKELLPMLRKSKGNILNIASMYGHVAPDYRLYDGDKFANPPSYGAAKAGVIQLTKYLASFLSSDGVRANCISPGPFPFDSTQEESPDFIQRLEEKPPIGRIGKPHELKGAAILLCSDAGSYITGQNVCVDGGWAVW